MVTHKNVKFSNLADLSNNVAGTASSGIPSLLVDARSSHSGDILQRVGQQGAEGAVGGGGQADQGVKERLHRTFHGPFLQVDRELRKVHWPLSGLF